MLVSWTAAMGIDRIILGQEKKRIAITDITVVKSSCHIELVVVTIMF